ncbi:MAG: HAMP domain-containing protein, partial [Pseudomonadales bacterium]|nr:HAMP domain-containing protein [Pseudomonadales bacterium]
MRHLPRLSLRTVLIGINLTVLVLPLAGIQLMRLYESALVRQTESALIAQGAFVAAFYRSLVLEQAPQNLMAVSREIELANGRWQDGRWSPRPAALDLASSVVLPPLPDGRRDRAADPFAASVGERLVPVLKDAQLVTLAGIRVVDPCGTIVASTGDDVGLSILAGEEVQLALAGTPSSRLRHKSDYTRVTALDSISRVGGLRVFVTAPIVLQGRLIGAVMLSRTPPSILQALYAKRWLLLQALGLLLALVVVMSLLTFRLIARPISRLADRASRISRGEISAVADADEETLAQPRTREIARLQEAITGMAQTLEERANSLQEFSRHVSHEFKTPIASIRGAIEVLQDHRSGMSEAQQMRFLEMIGSDAQRLHRLTERLLELTRAEIQQSGPEHFEVPDMIEEAVGPFSDRAEFDWSGVQGGYQARGRREVLMAV